MRIAGVWCGYLGAVHAVADRAILATEWKQFREPHPAVVDAIVRRKRIIDARSVLDEERWRSAGWAHRGLGRMTGGR